MVVHVVDMHVDCPLFVHIILYVFFFIIQVADGDEPLSSDDSKSITVSR